MSTTALPFAPQIREDGTVRTYVDFLTRPQEPERSANDVALHDNYIDVKDAGGFSTTIGVNELRMPVDPVFAEGGDDPLPMSIDHDRFNLVMVGHSEQPRPMPNMFVSTSDWRSGDVVPYDRPMY